jgi:putative phage-type endonuclease
MRGRRVAEAHRDRRKYLGGHDASRICGTSQYGTSADTYARIVHGAEQPQSPAMLRGQLLEPGILKWIGEQRRCVIDSGWFLLDSDVPFFGGSPDGVEGRSVLHEIKTTTMLQRHRWGMAGTDDIPQEVFVQVQWYMGITDADVTHVWVWFIDGDEDPQHYVVPRNRVSITEIRKRCEAFWWDHIVARVPPLPGVHDVGAFNTLDALYPRATAGILSPAATPPGLMQAAVDYDTSRAIEKMAEQKKKEIGAYIKEVLREHKGARWDGGSVTWSSHELPAKPNWEQIAHQIALHTKVSGEVFNGIVKENTFEAHSVRALRVTISKKKGG